MSQAILSRPVPVWSVGVVVAILIGAFALQHGTWPRSGDYDGATQVNAAETSGSSNIPWLPVSLFALAALGLAGAGLMLGRQNSPTTHRSAHAKPLSPDAVVKAATLLDLEVSRIDDVVTLFISGHERNERSLSSVQAKIAQVETKEQLRAVASLLLAENARMRKDAQDLSQKLEASRSQVRSLRTSLEKTQESLEQAQEEGLRDALTQVGNRRCFDATLAKAIDSATTNETPLSIIMSDIDHFKSVNDAHGHRVGDECLKILARLLTRIARDGDVVTRYGGEEFAIIMPNTPSMRAGIVAERLRSELESENLKLRDSNQPLKITASFGVSQLRSAESAEAFVTRADTRLYKAKQLGRNRVVTM